ncbi:hypothetical protein SAY87_004240 [Trapa incisa]|uniref:Remorin C-terminal domain-containing protein n=1 Tax=Trapa incisa TaxID=236973 RepID=A0AAN7JRC7_9MYRT|nr:hypothetical protein SAY87_004240 [Trapa incisa]
MGGQMEKNWFQRQLSSAEMSWNYDHSIPSEYAAAVAASAYAVHGIEETRMENLRKARGDLEASRDKLKSKTVDLIPVLSRRSSYKETEASARTTRESWYSPPSIAQKQMRYTNSTEAKANAWEKAQMENIRKRHDTTKSSILEWENEKKSRAKLSLERKKAGIEQRKAGNNEHYRIKMARIERIAAGARAQAEERKRNEELAVKEKAKRIRSGQVANVGCFFCF